ncbi:alpha/beta fold hydrolase [Pedobacter heparinus]|uniref:Dipeptidyl aminopeptidase/acylaminoacyl-peptidase n=1 Tax=Pedobacter heparinus (strain ATCC 13125 / DSM 2366 / CIP 104194 / JCM 7457 / NBRC 12017 / NCIMB 9290 / NRRL B-14731 / HIM 762-3) TaxID=485917 RepID=C6XZ84_PEDHD|nr:alpha/beta fold hydrolase [Pedobacter heparinus]ACU02566.1 Dipeptidyl aminopeptidase/acylaminoacyl-peptidase [Pedobacter heparinus DSM 2366]
MKIINFTKKLFAAVPLLFFFAGAALAIAVPIASSGPELLVYVNRSGQKKPVSTKAEWQIKRQQILERMQQVMGKLPGRKGLPAMDIQITDSLKEDGFTRYTINFTVAENEILPADLYIPHQSGKPKRLPAMLALHGTSALGKRSIGGESPLANRAYAKELAMRGYVVIAPDYPSFGDLKDYDFEKDRYESGSMKAIFNHMRCVDLLQARKDVDPERIGVIGHSLGGHNAIFAGAFDTRIKVVVSSCGWTLFGNYNAGNEVSQKHGGRLGPWAQMRYMPLVRDKYQLDAAQMPFDFDEAIASLAPRPFFSNSPKSDANFDVKGVKEGILNVTKVYKFLNADDKLQVDYPDAGHDFPPEVRLNAYAFIDKELNHTSIHKKLLF